MTLVYPLSIVGYLALGMLGAIAFLFLLLLFDKDVRILQNARLGVWPMAVMYAFLGGAVAAVVNVAANPDFGPSQFAVAFASGFGWPALAAGLGAVRAVGEVHDQTTNLTDVSSEARENLKKANETIAGAQETINKLTQALQSVLPQLPG